MVTVCVVTFNRIEKLKNCLKSISRQTFKDFECCVVNNGDEIKPSTILELKNDIRFNLINTSSNIGLARARNFAIRNSDRKYYTFLDDDDQWDENFLDEMVAMAESQNSNDKCYIGSTQHSGYMIYPCIKDFDNFNLNQIISKGFTPPVGSQFYHTKHLKQFNYNEDIESGIDHDLWFRLSSLKLKVQPVPLAISIPNNEGLENRITTNFEKRREKIIETIEIWKKVYAADFDLHFFENLKIGYLDYIEFRKLLRNINDKKYLELLKRVILISNKKYLIKELFFLATLKVKILSRKKGIRVRLKRTIELA